VNIAMEDLATHARPKACPSHVKDLAQDVAEDVLGAAKDGSAKVFIVKVLVYLSHRHLSVAEPTPRLPLGDTLRTGT